MEIRLKKEIERFYNEMDNYSSTDLGEIACSLVPKLVNKIKRLENELEYIACEKTKDITK